MRENRTNSEETVRRRTGVLTRILIVMLLLTGGGNVSAQPIRVDPRHPGVATLHEWGYMVGTLDSCVVGGEEFGRGIIPVGDISGDGIADFILERYRCDYATSGRRANELLLYHGVRGSLPDASSGQRIGPKEIGSECSVLAVGDWDNDGKQDIALRESIIGDTSNGNDKGYTLRYLVIYWGQDSGTYMITDTTHLSGGGGAWAGLHRGLAMDVDKDGVSDLIIWNGEGAGITKGEVVKLPKMYIYRGHNNSRWGRSTVRWTADWRWWEPPPMNVLYPRVMDHDCDGNLDIVMMNNYGTMSSVGILYGQPDELPDTTNVEWVSLASSGGEYTLFQDVTGDGMLDLVTWCGQTEEKIRIFAGAKGQRLIEQYGSGTDSVDKATGRYPLRPWAEIWMPSRLHDGWSLSSDILFDLGDLNGDGMSEVIARSYPFFIGYTTGRTIDSLIDILYQTPSGPVYTMTRLGDIDGSGEATIGVTYQGRVHFLKAKAEEIPTYGGTFRALPHPEGVVCGIPVSAAVAPDISDAPTFSVEVTPNPGNGSLRLRWNGEEGEGHVAVHDIAGREIYATTVSAATGACEVQSEAMIRGIYYVTLVIGSRRATVPVVVR